MSWFWWFWMKLLSENKDAFIQLPSEIKLILTAAIILAVGSSVFHKAFSILRYALIAAGIYFLLTYFGII